MSDVLQAGQEVIEGSTLWPQRGHLSAAGAGAGAPRDTPQDGQTLQWGFVEAPQDGQVRPGAAAGAGAG